MKRDMDLIRKMLLIIEANCVPGILSPIPLDGYTEDQIDYHFDLLQEIGFIEGTYYIGGKSKDYLGNFRMTWAGHDFLDAVRNDSVWARVKGKLAQVGGDAPLDVIKAVAVKVALDLIT